MSTFVCANCGLSATRYCGHGLCRACYVYRSRTGADRPERLYAPVPRRCLTCNGLVEPRAGSRCFACADYRQRTGRERPAALYARRRCGQCSHYLPTGAPDYQTLCGSCAGRWLAAVNAGEARTA